ncbi:hypothetical protein [Edaphobacter aggregans]|uniref:hypothetical protein n=1 Tax=Edaphobacter aggregans TaxID=570835 RepID=UPI0005523D4F|nr:hypothetical protein [Edaphobacter aggregans]
MPVDLKTLQLFILAALFAMLYAGRMVKGSPRETAEGLAFPLKPLVVWSRGIVLPLYFALFAWPMWQSRHNIPLWLPLFIVALVALILYQMPGTIVLTPTALVQRFWLRSDKTIRYGEVMSIQIIGAGRMTRVLGDNRVTITHTWNHSASEQFRKELERRTGKRVFR